MSSKSSSKNKSSSEHYMGCGIYCTPTSQHSSRPLSLARRDGAIQRMRGKMVSVAKLFRMIKCYSISPHCLSVLEEMAGGLILSGAALHSSRSLVSFLSTSQCYRASIKCMSICVSAHRWQKPRGKPSVTSQRPWLVACLGSGISAKLRVTSEQEPCCAREL